VSQLQSLDEKRDLYFGVAQATESLQVLTVEGGGVNSTAIQADIGTTNGVFHIVDKVLGIPYQTVHEKLHDDFDLMTTYLVGSHRNDYWHKRMDDKNQKFTYFAPSRAAWKKLKVEMPSEYKQLTEGLLPVHGEMILDRHLRVGELIPFEDLKNGKHLAVKTIRGELKVEGGPNGEVFLEWEGLRAKITRPDVRAVNGVIHVIDTVLMKKRDMTTNDSTASVASPLLLCVSAAFVIVTIGRQGFF